MGQIGIQFSNQAKLTLHGLREQGIDEDRMTRLTTKAAEAVRAAAAAANQGSEVKARG